MEINSPEEFIQAVNVSLMYMNRDQRITFVRWVKQRVNAYNFNYPQGYKETKNEPELVVDNPTVTSSSVDKSVAVDAVIVESSDSSSEQSSTNKSV